MMIEIFRKSILLLACISIFIVPIPCFGTDAGLQLSPEELAWIKEEHMVRVRIGSAPPLMITDGDIQGIAIDYLTTIFNRNGIKFIYVQESEVTWPQALKYIEQHEVVDMVPTAKITDERKKHMIFTNEYIVAPWVIFTRSDSDFVSSIDDLKGKTVAVEEGFVIHELLKREYPEINLKVASAKLDNNFAEIPIRDLSMGLVDAYIGNLLSTTYMIQAQGYLNIKVAAPTTFDNHNQAMAIRNDWPELASIINKTLASMTSDEHAAIRNKWFSIRYEYGINTFDILKWVLAVSGIASLFVLFFIIWNKRLKTEVVFRNKTEKELSQNLQLLDTANVELQKEITERKQAEIALRESEATIRNKLKAIVEPDGDIGTLELSDIIDTEVLQSMMEDFYKLTGMVGAVLDISGKVLTAVGWQDICTKFHRCHPDTLKNCTESDTILTNGVPPGEFRTYRCKNNMWDMVTPLMVGDRHVGNVFIGQFFYDDEVPDVELFRKQAHKYGFDEVAYLEALDRVPHFKRETVAVGMEFYSKLARVISTLSFGAIQQSRLLTERKRAEDDVFQLFTEAKESRRSLLSVVEDQKATEKALREAEIELKAHRDDLEKLIDERTAELRKVIQLMAGREIRMGELKEENKKMKEQLDSV